MSYSVKDALEARKKKKEQDDQKNRDKVTNALKNREARMQSSLSSKSSDWAERITAEIDAFKNFSFGNLSFGADRKKALEDTHTSRINLNSLRSEIEAYRKYIGQEKADKLISNIDEMKKKYDAYVKTAEFYSQFDTEDSYNKWKANEDWKKEIKSADDYAEYSQKGLDIKNPDPYIWEKAGWVNAYAKPANIATFARSFAVRDEKNGLKTDKGYNPLRPTKFRQYYYLNDEEVEIYSYFLGKGETEKAEEFLDSLKDTLAQREAGTYVNSLDDSEFLKVIFNPVVGLDQFMSGVKNIDNFIMGTEGDTTSPIQYAGSTIRENIDSKFGKGLWDLGVTISNQLPSILVGTLTGNIGGLATMGTSVLGNSYAEMRNLGYNEWQSRGYATLVTAAEMGLQSVLGGISSLGGKHSLSKLATNAINNVDNAIGRIALKWGKSMVLEGAEEAAQSVLEPVFKGIVTGEFEGIDWGEVAYSGLLGALSAGALEGVGIIASDRQTVNAGQQVLNVNGVDRLQAIGSTFSVDSVAYKLAGKVNENTGAYKIGTLLNEINATLTEQNKTDIVEALKSNNITGKDAKTITNALAAVVEGTQLTKKQQAALDNNEIISKSIVEFINQNSTVNQRIAGLEELAVAMTTGTKLDPMPKATETGKSEANASKQIDSSDVQTANESQFSHSDDGKTTYKGEEVSVKEISSIKDGAVTVRLEDGREVDAKEVDFGTEDEALMYEMVASMGVTPDTAKYMMDTYNTGKGTVTIEDFRADAPLAYQSGKIGYVRGTANLRLTDNQKQELFALGRKDAMAEAEAMDKAQKSGKASTNTKLPKFNGEKVEKNGIIYEDVDPDDAGLKDVQKASIVGIEMLAKASSLEIHVFKSYKDSNGNIVANINGKIVPAPNGMFMDGNKIYLDINAGNKQQGTMLYTMSHEVGHFIRKWNAKAFKELGDFLFDHYEGGADSVKKLIDKEIENRKKHYEAEGKKLPSEMQLYDEAYEEVVCNSLSKMFADENAYIKLAELKKQNQTLWEKLGEAIKAFLDKLKEVIGIYSKKENAPDNTALATGFDMGTFNQLQDLYIKAFVEADANYQAATTQTGENVSEENISHEGEKFQLRDNVEETGTLVAVHNLSEQKLLKSLQLGGLPMPSIAIARARDGHNEFGDISLVFRKETIDPKSNHRNKVYSGDAWTPTYPRVEYKLNGKAQQRIREKINNLVPASVQEGLDKLHLDSDNMDDTLNHYNGDMVDAYKNSYSMKYAYLVDNGIDIDLPMKSKPLSRWGMRDDGAIINVAEKFSEQELIDLLNADSEEVMKAEFAIRDAVTQNIYTKYEGQPEVIEALLPKEELSLSEIYNYIQDAENYLRNGIQQTVDENKARNLIAEKVDQPKYEAWLKELFSDVVEKEGIRNDKDYFTPSGNRRSFEALHYEHNLENVIKAMKEKGTQGIGGFGGGNIFGASATEFSSINDIRNAQERLQNMSQEEYDEIRQGFSDKFFELSSSLPKNKSSFTSIDSAADMLVEAVLKFKTKSGIANYLKRECEGWANYSDYVVDDLIELVNGIRQMPTRFFEAKPQRAVGFDEVATAIIPNSASEELKSKLTDMRIDYVEYAEGNNDARLEVLNSLEDVKFSDRDFAAEIDQWNRDGKPEGETFILGSTGNVLQGLGAIENDIFMRGDKIKEILVKHPEMTLAEIKKIPQILENPALILKSRNVDRNDKQNTRLVIFGTIKAKNGLPILTVLDLRPSENHLIIEDLQKVTSAYTKDYEPISFVRNSDVLYAEKKRATSVLRSIGFYMPIELNKSGFIGSISYKGRSVNIFGEKFSKIFTEVETKLSYRDQELAAQKEKVNEVLEKENAKLKEDNQYLKELVKLQRKVTHGTKFTKSSVELVAGRLMKYANAKGNRAELVKLLNEFYGYIAGGNDLTWDSVAEKAQPAIDWLKNNFSRSEKLDAYSREVLNTIRSKRIYLDEHQQAEAAYVYGSFYEYRKKAMGSLTIVNKGNPNGAISLDSQWQEFAGMYPELFDADMNPNEMPMKLLEIVSDLRDFKAQSLDYEYADDMIDQDLLSKVYDSYWDVSTLHTVADSMQKDINLLKIKHHKKMAEVREFHNEKHTQLKKEYQDKLARVREEYRERNAKTTRELMTRYQESRAKATEGRHKTEIRHKIKDVVSKLNQLLLRPTKDKHIKEELRMAVAEALSAINMDTIGADERVAKYNELIAKTSDPDMIAELTKTRDRIELQGETLKEKLTALKDAYEKIKNSTDDDLKNAYQETVLNTIKNVSETVGSTSIRDMSLTQLEAVYEMYTMVLHTVRTANKMFKAEKGETITQTAEAVNEDIRNIGKEKFARNRFEEWLRKTGWTLLKPFTAFRTIGSDTFTKLYTELRKGEDVFYEDVNEAKEFIQEKYKKYNFKSWEQKQTKTFTAKSGKTFTLTLEQMMSLYAYSRRTQAHDHIIEGGIVLEDSVLEVKKHGVPIKYKVDTKTAFNISEETLDEICDSLTKEQKAFVEEMQTYLSDVMGAKGNEVSMELLGVKLFKEKFYFPLKSSKYYMGFKPEEAGEIKLKNPAFSKETVQHANNPVVLKGFTDVWATHVNDMSMYHAFVLALEDFTRVYNYKTKTDANVETMSTEATIANAHGDGATQYIRNFLRSLNGGVRVQGTPLTEGLISKTKKAAVLGSASVAIQQPSAIMRAMALINPKYFVASTLKSFNFAKHNKDWAEIKQYAPIAGIKEMGRFDMGLGQGTVDWIKDQKTIGEKAEDILSKAPALMDEITWVSIWQAVKKEVASTNKGLQVDSEAFLKKCGERFTEVVSLTQVYDSVFSRSDLMRNENPLAKMLTAFMAEPSTTLNMFVDSWIQGKRTGSKKGFVKVTAATTGAIVGSIVLNSALKSIITAMRDDHEDESYLESYHEAFTKNMVDGLMPFNYIPLVKDIWSICQGYDVERMDMALISDLASALDAFDSDSKTEYEKWTGLTGALAALLGVPFKNVERDIRGAYNTIQSFINGEKTTEAGIKIAIREGLTGKEISNKQQLYEAIINGDQEQIARVKARYNDKDKLKSAIRSAFKEYYIKGDLDYDSAIRYLVEHCDMDEDEAYWKIQEWDYEIEHGKDAEYSKYDDFFEAVESGKNLRGVIREYTDNGVKTTTLESQITSHFKPLYKEMTNYERAKIKGYLLNAYALLGKDRTEKSKDIDNWLKDD